MESAAAELRRHKEELKQNRLENYRTVVNARLYAERCEQQAAESCRKGKIANSEMREVREEAERAWNERYPS